MMAIAERELPALWSLGNEAAPGSQADTSFSMAPRPGELEFQLPAHLEAAEPPEMRGLARDEVRLLVSYRSDDRLKHARFRDLPAFLDPGDVVVINTSGTLPAALPATRSDGQALELHLSTQLAADCWTVLVITPARGLRVVSSMLTGFHEPRASHLLMLEALAGRAHLSLAYGEALRQGYLWHEFGDSHLIL